ncbi:ABC transporter permease [Cryobacterium sp. TMT2-17-1]|uniref:ABC transporter permease n=2 Tax=unclassified Cryobacterium TaxID=2649013 RepID=UPI00106A9DD1|nr:ABC transporter permease [Cryobacterium sp. Sr3]TFB55525.1 ABC transporter permease [Cryobacterium sp. Sr3]TFC48644.1 ABC transporter permease [Cryobacterium sp. TMT2-17-1]
MKLRMPNRRRATSAPAPVSDGDRGAAPAITRADRFSVQDLIVEAGYGIGARPTRLIMTTLGTTIRIASLVVTIGFAQTAAGQIARQFDAVAATQVVIEPGSTDGMNGSERATGRLPWDAPDRVSRLAGVELAGLVSEVPLDAVTITAVPVNDPSEPATLGPSLMATFPGLLDAVRGNIVTGRYFDTGHDARADRVAVLGSRAADRLGINRVDSQPSIFIGDSSYTVIGIIDGMERRSDLLDAVVVPMGTARADFGLTGPDELQIRIALGAGKVVAEQAPLALDPNAAQNFEVQAPSARSALRENVQADVNVISLILGVLALVAGGLGIANVTLLSVMERVGEIGLRRALGATKRNISSQFMVESVVIGLLGGLIGAALGVFAVVIMSPIQQWAPVVDPWLAAGSALLGAVVGLATGVYPALKASNIEPIVALRGGN